MLRRARRPRSSYRHQGSGSSEIAPTRLASSNGGSGIGGVDTGAVERGWYVSYDAAVAATTGNDREARLEAALADANRQLLERDEELISIARDEELRHARDTLQAFERRLQRYARDIEQLNRAIAEM